MKLSIKERVKRDKELLGDFKKGLTCNELTKRYKISRQRIFQIIDSTSTNSLAEIKKVRKENQKVRHVLKAAKISDSKALRMLLVQTRAVNIHSLAKHLKTNVTCLSYLRKKYNIVDASKYTKERVVQCLQHLCHIGEPLTSGHLQASHRALYNFAIKFFGNYERALEEAGVLFEPAIGRRFKKRKHTEKSFIQIIQSLYNKGEDISSCATSRKYPYLHTLSRRFYHLESIISKKPVWEIAITKAGLDYNIIRKR